jgi:hypothetical protein
LWIKNHKSHPYETDLDLLELSCKTGLKEDTIQKWIRNQRSRSKSCLIDGKKPSKSFTNEQKTVLNNFFINKSKHPGPDELEKLETIIKKDRKKIRQWFADKRRAYVTV